MHAESSVNPNPGGRPHPNLIKEGVFKLDGLQDCWIICFVQFQDKGLHGGNKILRQLKVNIAKMISGVKKKCLDSR